MDYKNKLLKAISEMTDDECERIYKYIPRRLTATETQKNCNHSMKYDISTGGSTCIKVRCGWMS